MPPAPTNATRTYECNDLFTSYLNRTSICRPAGSHTWLWSDAELARTAPDVARQLRDAADTDALQRDQPRRVRQACIRTAFSAQAGRHCCTCWPSCMRQRTAGCMIRANMSVLSDLCAKRHGNLVIYALMDPCAISNPCYEPNIVTNALHVQHSELTDSCR